MTTEAGLPCFATTSSDLRDLSLFQCNTEPLTSTLTHPDRGPGSRNMLIISNSGYASGHELEAGNDAMCMLEHFRDRGFEVTWERNLTAEGMKNKMRAFVKSFRKRQKGEARPEILLFYFSGHACQSGSTPIDSEALAMGVDGKPVCISKHFTRPLDKASPDGSHAIITLMDSCLTPVPDNPSAGASRSFSYDAQMSTSLSGPRERSGAIEIPSPFHPHGQLNLPDDSMFESLTQSIEGSGMLQGQSPGLGTSLASFTSVNASMNMSMSIRNSLDVPRGNGADRTELPRAPPNNLLVSAYATEPGQEALQPDRGYSLWTAALSEAMRTEDDLSAILSGAAANQKLQQHGQKAYTQRRRGFTKNGMPMDTILLDRPKNAPQRVPINTIISSSPNCGAALFPTTIRHEPIRKAPPAALADTATRKDFIRHQLEWFGRDGVILDDLQVLQGPAHQLEGGQSIVQIAKDREGALYALKFFASEEAFNREVRIYRGQMSALGCSELSRCQLPLVRRIVDRHCAGFTDPTGNPLPPCIVMEKGESLDLILKRGELSHLVKMSVIQQIAERLRSLHRCKVAHRDIKPSNVLLRESNRFTLIDFGCAERIKEYASAICTPAYAAPEVMQARHDKRQVYVSDMLDSWSLGVLAFELLTGKLWSQGLSEHEVGERILDAEGRRLPWEARPFDEETAHRLRSSKIKHLILQLLDRNPAKRLPVDRFLEEFKQVVPCATSTGESESSVHVPTEATLSMAPVATSIEQLDSSHLKDVRTMFEDLYSCPSDTVLDLNSAVLGVPEHSHWCPSKSKQWADVAMIPYARVTDVTVQAVEAGLFQLGRPLGVHAVFTVTGTDKLLRNGTVNLREGHCVVFDSTCRFVTLQNMTINGGAVVCSGARAIVYLKNVNFINCSLTVLYGAEVNACNCVFSCEDSAPRVAIFAQHQNATIHLSNCTIKGGAQGAAVYDGGVLKAKDLVISDVVATGIEVRGVSSRICLEDCSVQDCAASTQAFKHTSDSRAAGVGGSSRLCIMPARFFSHGILVHSKANLKGCSDTDLKGCSEADLKGCSIRTFDCGLRVAGGKAKLQLSTVTSARLCCLRAEAKASVKLYGCTVSDSSGWCGMFARDKDTIVAGDKCRLLRNEMHGAYASHGAALRMRDCLSECNRLFGFWAAQGGELRLVGCNSKNDGSGFGCSGASRGKEAKVIAEGTKVKESTLSGVRVHPGGSASLQGCLVSACGHGVRVEGTAVLKECTVNHTKHSSGLMVAGVASRATVERCRFEKNNLHGVCVDSGASVSLQACEAVQNGSFGYSRRGANDSACLQLFECWCDDGVPPLGSLSSAFCAAQE